MTGRMLEEVAEIFDGPSAQPPIVQERVVVDADADAKHSDEEKAAIDEHIERADVKR